MTELKPCPFCGGKEAYITRNCYGQNYARYYHHASQTAPNRRAGCHTKCEKYKAYHAENERDKARKAEQQKKAAVMCEYARHVNKRVERRTKRNNRK